MQTVLFNDTMSSDRIVASANESLVRELNDGLVLRGVPITVHETSSFIELAAQLTAEEVPLVFTNFPMDQLLKKAQTSDYPERAIQPIPNYVAASHWMSALGESHPRTFFFAITGAPISDEAFSALTPHRNFAIARKDEMASGYPDLQVAMGRLMAREISQRLLHGRPELDTIVIRPRDRRPQPGGRLGLQPGEVILDRPLMRYSTLTVKHRPRAIVFLSGGSFGAHLCMNLRELGIPFRFADVPVEEWDEFLDHPRYLKE